MSLLSPVLLAAALVLPPPVELAAHESLRADRITQHAGLRALLQELERGPDRRLVIGHPGGEAGAARAEQLRAALVALGLGSARIALAPQPLSELVLILSLEKSAK